MCVCVCVKETEREIYSGRRCVNVSQTESERFLRDCDSMRASEENCEIAR